MEQGFDAQKAAKNGQQDAYIQIHEKRIATMEGDIKEILQRISNIEGRAGGVALIVSVITGVIGWLIYGAIGRN